MFRFEDFVAFFVGVGISSSDEKMLSSVSLGLDTCIVLLWLKAVYLSVVAVVDNGPSRARLSGLICSCAGIITAVYVMCAVRDEPDHEPRRLRVQTAELALAAGAVVALNGQIKAWLLAGCAALRRCYRRRLDLPVTAAVSVTVTSNSGRMAEQVHDALGDAIAAVAPVPVRVSTEEAISCSEFTSITTAYHFTQFVC